MTLGEKIRVLRTSSQLSQESIAALVGVSRQSVSKWEKGLAIPSAENLKRLSDIFSISVEEFMNESIEMTKYYNTFHFFKDMIKNKKIYIPLCILMTLFLVALIVAIVLKKLAYYENIVYIFAGISAGSLFIAYIILLSVILRYVYLDCQMRHIQPLWYVLISITWIGLVYYLLRRDEISYINKGEDKNGFK